MVARQGGADTGDRVGIVQEGDGLAEHFSGNREERRGR